MRYNIALLMAASACLMVSACDKKDDQPKGQVVATVDGKEITAIDLRNEMNGFNPPDAKTRKAAEMQALQQIIARKVLFAGAQEAKVDKSPEYAQRKQRMEEALLVESWRDQIVRSVPTPSRDEASKYVADHPEIYANRKIFEVDQIAFQRPADAAIFKEFEPLKTLEELAAFLSSRNIPFKPNRAEVDALTVDPNIIKQIVALPPGEVFIVPAGDAVIANRIRGTRDAPLVGEQAVKHATARLKAQRSQEAAQRQFGAVMQAAKKDIVYSKAYTPPAPAKPAATPAVAK